MRVSLFTQALRLAVAIGAALLVTVIPARTIWAQLPVVPGVEVPDVPKVPDAVPAVPDVPQVPDVAPPAAPAVPDPKLPAPVDPKAPATPAVPAIPATPAVPAVPGTPAPPALPAVPGAPAVPAIPGVDPKLPDAARNPDAKLPGANVDVDARAKTHADFNAANVRSADIGLWLGAGANTSLRINGLNGRGRFGQLGFREGDYILSVNGQRVGREADFMTYLFAPNVRAGRVQVVVWRGGREEIIWVQPSLLINDYYAVQTNPAEDFGVILDDRYPNQLVVWRVVPRSPAFYAGIQPGDVLVTLRGRPIGTHAQFTTAVQGLQPGAVQVQVMRNRRNRVLDVDYNVRAGAQTTLKPVIDDRNDVERPNEAREKKIEDRRDIREDLREGRAPDLDPNAPPHIDATNPPAVAPAPAPIVTEPTYVAPRRGAFRRGR